MKKKLKLGFAVLAAVLIAAGAFYLATENTVHRAIGGLIWIGEAHEEAPDAESFTLEYVDCEDGTIEIYCDNPDLMPAALIKEFRDGEVFSVQSYADPRLGDVSCKSAGEDGEINVTITFDKTKELHTFIYKIYEKNDGSLYAKAEKDAEYDSVQNLIISNLSFEDRKRNLGCMTVSYEGYTPYDEIVVKFFDENDTVMDRFSFIPEAVDGSASKPANAAYAICESHCGDTVERKIVEDDLIEYLGFDKKLHIGVPCTQVLTEENK